MRYVYLLLMFYTVIPISASGDTLYVPGDHPRIQLAIYAANSGDTILVDSGTYNEILDFVGKDLVVKSVNGPEDTVIDAKIYVGRSVVKFRNGETKQAVLDGFTLVNGTGDYHEVSHGKLVRCGGGIFCLGASPTIKNNIIKNNNVSGYGGGVFIQATCFPELIGNSIEDNLAEERGGGIYCCDSTSPTLVDNVISDNESLRCGGIYVDSLSTLQMEGCEVSGNESTSNTAAVYCTKATVHIDNCTISKNTPRGLVLEKTTGEILKSTISHNSPGGGIYCTWGCELLIEDNFIANNYGNTTSGGGIFCGYGCRVIHNLIQGNTAENRGGGIRANRAMEIRDNTIRDNVSGGQGGGLFCASSIGFEEPVMNNVITGNSAIDGAGICLDTNTVVDLINNEICNNTATRYGGGIYADYVKAHLVDNLIKGNSTFVAGGGIYNVGVSRLHIIGNAITENTCDGSGGGMHIEQDHTSTIYNNVIASNKAYNGGGFTVTMCENIDIANNVVFGNEAELGGGIHFIDVYHPFSNNTVFGNAALQQGGGITVDHSIVELSNFILWDNTAPQGAQISQGDGAEYSVVRLDHSAVLGGQSGIHVGSGSNCAWKEGMITEDPQFADPLSGDFHLLYTSPCRDAGTNNTITVTEDFEGDPRIASGMADMGADEFHHHLYCIGDFTPQGEVQANILGDAGSSPVYLVFSGALLAEPLNLAIGTFYLEMPWILINLMSTVPPSGLLQLPAELPRLPEAPYDLHMQALVAGKLTNLFTMEVR